MKDGGPAFPSPLEAIGENDQFNIISQQGMSLRDWFAGQALAALWKGIPSAEQAEVIADSAYKVADAMIAEREKS